MGFLTHLRRDSAVGVMPFEFAAVDIPPERMTLGDALFTVRPWLILPEALQSFHAAARSFLDSAQAAQPPPPESPLLFGALDSGSTMAAIKSLLFHTKPQSHEGGQSVPLKAAHPRAIIRNRSWRALVLWGRLCQPPDSSALGTGAWHKRLHNVLGPGRFICETTSRQSRFSSSWISKWGGLGRGSWTTTLLTPRTYHGRTERER